MELTRRICKSYKSSLGDKEIEKLDGVSQDSMWIHWINPYSVLRTPGVILPFFKITRFINIMSFIAW